MASTTRPTIVLITGANTGLGFEIAKALFGRPYPYHIILSARGPLHRAQEAVSNLQTQITTPGNPQSTATPLSIDITSDSSISTAAETLAQSPGKLDILVNNAAVLQSSRLTPRQGFQQAHDVNVTRTHLLTEKLIPLMLLNSSSSSKRLIFITSGMSSISENASGTSPRCSLPRGSLNRPAASKAALNMVATEWSRVLKHDGVKVFNIPSGFLATGLGADPLRPEIGGEFLADVVQGKRDTHAWSLRILRKDVEQDW
ncbi:putative oxidoreductase [Rhypophila sp. PSN 637]